MDPRTFAPSVLCIVKLENGENITIIDEPVAMPKYEYLGKSFKKDELDIITIINTRLSDLGMFPMTLEEAEYMFNWDSIPGVSDTATIENIQKLSGFVVEKTIKYI